MSFVEFEATDHITQVFVFFFVNFDFEESCPKRYRRIME